MKLAKLLFVAGCIILLVANTAAVAFAQTGTINGRVTDQRTGDPRPFVNIVVKGTSTGAATGVDPRVSPPP
ncbi:carboxypeptidase-like regulatory domain-containing protein, partial [Sphingobacteriales bacterium CHB3]|nr:carboxypeptidase-like regulatory domain-containing protein [Sphingobacteriales bacterium CHB3]